MAAEYKIDFAENITFSAALAQLNEDLSFTQQVDRGLDELLRTESIANNPDADNAPIARGTWRQAIVPGTDQLVTFNIPISETYNTAYFDIRFGSELAGSSNETIVSTSTSRVDPNDFSFGHPTFGRTTEMAHMRFESALTLNVPLKQQALTMGGLNDQASVLSLETDNVNYKLDSAVVNDAHITTQGHILDARIFNQETIENNTEGREYTPMYSLLYNVNEYEPDSTITTNITTDDTTDDSTVEETITDPIDYGSEPTWLTSAGFKEATDARIENFGSDTQSSTNFADHHIFSWEVHGLRTETDFSISALNGKEYGVISFGIALSDSSQSAGASPFALKATADIMNWRVAGNSVSATQVHTDGFYETLSLSRNFDGSISPVSSSTTDTIDNSRRIDTRSTEIDNTNHSGGTTSVNVGLLSLDDGNEQPLGHSTEDGNYLAFSFNTTDTSSNTHKGSGLILAMALNSGATNFSDDRTYHLQGNTLSVLGQPNQNVLTNWNGSTLTIDGVGSNCNATLSLANLQVEQVVTENESSLNALKQTFNPSENNSIPSTGCDIQGNFITVNFAAENSSLSKDLVLKGFLSNADSNSNTGDESSNLLTLVWQQEDTLGLILGHKDQKLCPTFADQGLIEGSTRCAN